MGALLYFVETAGGPAELLRAAGLEYALPADGAGVSATLVGSAVGPGGRSGTVLCRARDYPAGLPEPICWAPAAGAALPCWIGWHAPGAARLGHVRPDDLLREDVAIETEHAVRLADGQWWRVVRVLACSQRCPARRSELPTVYRLVSEGGAAAPAAGLIEDVYGEYRPLVAECQEALRSAEGDEQVAAGLDALALAGRILGVLYRVSAAELLALELVGPREVEAVLRIAIDFDERVLAAAERLAASEDAARG